MAWFKHHQAKDDRGEPYDFAAMVRQAREEDPQRFGKLQRLFAPKKRPASGRSTQKRHAPKKRD